MYHRAVFAKPGPAGPWAANSLPRLRLHFPEQQIQSAIRIGSHKATTPRGWRVRRCQNLKVGSLGLEMQPNLPTKDLSRYLLSGRQQPIRDEMFGNREVCIRLNFATKGSIARTDHVVSDHILSSAFVDKLHWKFGHERFRLSPVHPNVLCCSSSRYLRPARSIACMIARLSSSEPLLNCSS